MKNQVRAATVGGALMARWSLALVVVALAAPVHAESAVKTLTLADALRNARAVQPRTREARAQSAAARARALEARAPLLPQVSATAGYQRTTANFVARPGAVPSALAQRRAEASFNTFDFYTFGVTASQLVYDFGQTSARFRAASSSARAREEDQRAMGLEVDVEVRRAYFAAQAAQAIVAVAREALGNQERHLAQVQAFVQVGRSPEIDLAQVRTDLANARVNLIRSEAAYELTKARLNVAMGVEDATTYDVSGDVLPPVPDEDASTDALLSAAFSNRPELASLRRQTEAQRRTVRATRGGYGPALSVSTAFTDAGTKLDDLTWNWNAGVLLSWPLFQGGLTHAQMREARASLEAIAARTDGARLQIRLELEEARLAIVAAKAVIEAADEAVRAAEQRRGLAEGRYEAGVGNVIELEDAELALTEARAQRVRADFELSTSRALLLRALGRPE